MEKMFVKPVAGRRCKDPASYELLPEGGKSVTKNSYWLRRLKDGDCVLAERGGSAAPVKKKAEPKAGGSN